MLRAVARRREEVGRLTALFYAVNTLGATAGVALAGFVAIRVLGLYATLLIAAASNLVVALGCVLLSRPIVPLAAPAAKRESPLGPPFLLAVFFVMGATSLAYEVLWTRVLVFYLGSSVYAYSLMLFIFLLGIGGGSLLIARWADRLRRPIAALAVVELAIAVLALVEVALFGRLTDALIVLSEWLRPNSFARGAVVQFLSVIPILLPPTLLMGISFPLAVRCFSRSLDRLGTEVGTVYGANTVGSIVGSLAAGFVLIPAVGTQNSILVVGAVNAALAALLWIRPEEEPSAARRRWWIAAAPLLCLAAIPLFPADRAILGAGMFHPSRPEDLVYFHEDASGTVTILERHDGAGPRKDYLSLELNGVNVAGTSPELYAVQKMQGHLPLLLGSGVESVVHIGLGSGGTAHAVSEHPVESILVVEISPQVLYASGRYFTDVNHHVLDDPRLDVEINDGRNFLLASPRTFDAVLSDSIHPRYAGNGSLYSREYFGLVRERMNPGGVVSMWLPMYSLTPRNYAMIVKAFRDVFPRTAVWYEPSTLNSYTIVTGKLGGAPWNHPTLERVFADPGTRRSLAELDIHGPADVLACYLLGGEELDEWLAPVPAHVDDLPAVEYESGTLLDRNRPWLRTFAEMVSRRPADPPAAYLDVLPPAERERAVAVYRQRRELLDEHVRFMEEAFRNDPRQIR
jgi:spermidine synthase